MTDADTNGAHIQILLLTFLFRFIRPLLEQNYFYIVKPPLFKISFKSQSKKLNILYAWIEEELKIY